MQHCLAEAQRDRDIEIFRTYIANSVNLLAQGKAFQRTYSEILNDLDAPTTEIRTGDEIKRDIKDGLNKLRKGGNSKNGFNEFGGETIT